MAEWKLEGQVHGKMILDDWQKKVLETKGNICLRAGRQGGKSTAISIKAGEFAARNPRKTILIIASVERQAYLLFEKTLNYLFENYRRLIKIGKDRPTKHRIMLTNGNEIYCLPTGLSGYGIRGYTFHLLIADEAAFIPEEVWTSVTPMLAVTGGEIILLSTPCGKSGYFYNCFQNDNFTKFHVSSEDCLRKNQSFLDEEKKRMTRDARALHVTLREGTREIRGPARVTIRLEPGDRLALESAGGGGWGIPFQRSIMRLEEDLVRGVIGPDQSRNRYGLVLKPGSLEKDDYLTYRVRHYLLSTLAVEDIIAGEELLD